MGKRTYPRKQAQHELRADEILRHHYLTSGVAPALPVPIEPIIESTFGLSLLYDEIEEPDNRTIFGALSPTTKTIIINTRHLDLFEQVVGPERFTLAHELAHWVYDAENPAQGQFDLSADAGAEVFCYDRNQADGISNDHRLREMNANKLAAALLLPKSLMMGVAIDDVVGDPRKFARDWGVSPPTLAIRLEGLGLVESADKDQMSLL